MDLGNMKGKEKQRTKNLFPNCPSHHQLKQDTAYLLEDLEKRIV